MKHPVAVIAVLSLQSADNKVTVLILGRVISISAVLALGVDNRQFGDADTQLLKLIKKRSGKIKVPAVMRRIAFVAPPHILVIDFIGLVGRVDGNYLVAHLAALSLVKAPLVAKGESPALSTAWTIDRLGNFHELGADSRRDFTIERETAFA
jgi:hypothetical protein